MCAAVILCLLLPLAACENARDSALTIAGSTSVQPYVEIVAEEYEHLYPDKFVEIQGGGSSAGITAVDTGTAEIGMISRELKESERHFWSVEIAKDGLAIIINPANPVQDVTLEQIRGVYAADITNWADLGGLDARIHIITREEGSGTRSAFEDLVMGGRRITPKAIVQDSNGAVRQLVSDDPYSIGFISLGLVHIGERPVKSMKLDGVEATRENVVNGSYSLFRPFLFVVREEPTGITKQYIDFILSPEGQRILSDEGLIPE